MKNHLFETLRRQLKNRNVSETATVGDIKKLLEYLHEIDKDFLKREEQIWYAVSQIRCDWAEYRDFFLTRPEFDEFMRERYFPLFVETFGKPPTKKSFNPVAMENMG